MVLSWQRLQRYLSMIFHEPLNSLILIVLWGTFVTDASRI